jgi:hypothetical protein
LFYSLFRIRVPSHLDKNWFLLCMCTSTSMPTLYDAVIHCELYYHTIFVTPRCSSILNKMVFFNNNLYTKQQSLTLINNNGSRIMARNHRVSRYRRVSDHYRFLSRHGRVWALLIWTDYSLWFTRFYWYF